MTAMTKLMQYYAGLVVRLIHVSLVPDTGYFTDFRGNYAVWVREKNVRGAEAWINAV